jgi:hypothetical protein
MSTETNNFVAAIAQANSFIPSLHNLAVETIKTFVNPGIKELEKTLLEDSEKKLTHNNDLRCIAEESIGQGIRGLSEDIDLAIDRNNERTREVMNLIEETRDDILECVNGEYITDMSLYKKVQDMDRDIQHLHEKIDRLLEIIEPEERKRRDRNERKRARRREREEENKKTKI